MSAWTDWSPRAAEKVRGASRNWWSYDSGLRDAGVGVMLTGRSVVVVDDGLATGASMWAALIAIREATSLAASSWPCRVAPPEPLALLAPLVDEEICSVRPTHMQAVGAWYEDFSQTTAAEVAGLLAEFADRPPNVPGPSDWASEAGTSRAWPV